MKVLEFGNGLSAAYAGKLFAACDMEVIRVDSANLTQSTRDAALELYLHAGKRRVFIDYDNPKESGAQDLRRLMDHCDIIVTDEHPQILDQLDWANPGHPSIRVSISPFGLFGPYRNWRANGAILQAMGGMTSIIGDPGREPLTIPGNLVEYQSAQMAYIAAMATLVADSGQIVNPRQIEVSMLETVMSMSQFTTIMWTCRQEIRQRFGNGFSNVYPINLYPCKDGWICVNIVPAFWDTFTRMLGDESLANDPRFATNDARLENRVSLDELITGCFADKTMAELMESGQRGFRVPLGSLYSLQDLLDDEHLAARHYFQKITDVKGATFLAPGPAWRDKNFRIPKDLTSAAPASTTLDELLSERPPGDKFKTGTPPGRSSLPDQPLKGIRIMDLTHVWAGPLATRILADLGAEVLKLEAGYARGPAIPPGKGLYPGGHPGDEPWNRQALFNKLNRNKKGLSFDLKEDEGKELFFSLVSRSDIIIENFSATAMERLNLGFEKLSRANPEIIYIAMPGYGAEGPHSDFVAFGPSVEPMTGLAALMGYSDDEPHTSAIALPDAIAGITAAAAAVSALFQRLPNQGKNKSVQQRRAARHIDLALVEATINMLGEQLIEYQMTGRAPIRQGNHIDHASLHGLFACRGPDDWIVISCLDEIAWGNLAKLMGIGGDERFANPDQRKRNRARLYSLINAWTGTHDKIALMSQLQAIGVSAGAVLDASEFMSDPHHSERGYFITLGGGQIEPLAYPGLPLFINGSRHQAFVRAPMLGEHNADILGELLGFDRQHIARLTMSGILHHRPTS